MLKAFKTFYVKSGTQEAVDADITSGLERNKIKDLGAVSFFESGIQEPG